VLGVSLQERNVCIDFILFCHYHHVLFPALRVLRFYDPSQSTALEHKSSVGRGGHRIDASRNFWDGSGLKIDSASTDVAWGRGGMCVYFSHLVLALTCVIRPGFNTKVLTSARNGELIMWDLNKSGPNKYGEWILCQYFCRLWNFAMTPDAYQNADPRTTFGQSTSFRYHTSWNTTVLRVLLTEMSAYG
jgi:hypothetical protein